jgi:hypothetical protein
MSGTIQAEEFEAQIYNIEERKIKVKGFIRNSG